LRERLARLPAPAVDVALAAAVAVAVAIAIGAEMEAGARAPDALAYVLGAAVAAPLLLRRRSPLAVLLLSTVALLVYYAFDYPPIGLAVPLAAALFIAVAAGHLWTAALVAVAIELLASGVRALGEGDALNEIAADGLEDGALVAAVLLLAETLRTRSAWLAEVQERIRRTEADRERDAQLRVEQERLRIAREMHDVLAHTITVIGVQAGVAAEAMADSPAEAQAALRTIRETSREALVELRATVGLLRESSERAPRSPAPRLSRLDELVRMAAGAEVDVEVSVSGTPRPLPAIVDLTAYRIIQESLTNVLRHAGASLARVSIQYGRDEVVVQVEDDGRGRGNGAGQGYGVTGMRERALAVGGRLEAGPAPSPGRGFRVRATLPT
jgi:signal transduction histidine kinase